MELQQKDEKDVRRVYHRIIALALAAHASYIAIFTILAIPKLAAYNLISLLFYCLMQFIVGHGYYRLAVSCIHMEVSLFAVVCTLMVGWDIGIALYLLAMTSLVYFCPFKHKYVPYIFAAMEICVFWGLRLYTGYARPGYLAVSEEVGLWLYMYDISACFAIVLYAAFSSKVSATVSCQKLVEENRSLTALANYDQLTGLLSRHAFLARLDKFRGNVAVLVLSDIDDFKKINDTYGHACGDQVLIESAELIRSHLSGEADVCRWGGEEFVYLFRGLPMEAVLVKVQELRDAISEHTFRCEGLCFHITMTFGVSQDSEGISLDKLVELADKQMYKGKISGKNRVVFADFCIGEDADHKSTASEKR